MAIASRTGRVLTDLSAQANEIAALKAQLAAANAKLAGEASCTRGIDKHGNAVLNFTGNFMPFSFTQSKCKKLIPFIAEIKSFGGGK